MSKDAKKAHPEAATSEQAKESDFGGQKSRTHSTTHNNHRQSGLVASVLQYGEENAVPGKYLVGLLDLKDGRELTKRIERERREGAPICATTNSDNPGYFLAESPAELEKYIHSLDRRLRHVRATREACQDTLLRMTGQRCIGEVDVDV